MFCPPYKLIRQCCPALLLIGPAWEHADSQSCRSQPPVWWMYLSLYCLSCFVMVIWQRLLCDIETLFFSLKLLGAFNSMSILSLIFAFKSSFTCPVVLFWKLTGLWAVCFPVWFDPLCAACKTSIRKYTQELLLRPGGIMTLNKHGCSKLETTVQWHVYGGNVLNACIQQVCLPCSMSFYCVSKPCWRLLTGTYPNYS